MTEYENYSAEAADNESNFFSGWDAIATVINFINIIYSAFYKNDPGLAQAFRRALLKVIADENVAFVLQEDKEENHD